jgi:hypothetical protein
MMEQLKDVNLVETMVNTQVVEKGSDLAEQKDKNWVQLMVVEKDGL